MCFLHQEPHVGHVLASSEAKEGSQQPHEWLKGWNRTWLCSLEKERKNELHSALSFVSLMAGRRL